MEEEEKRKKERLGKIGKKKLEMKEKLIQKKLTETLSRLPEKEKVKFRNEEEKKGTGREERKTKSEKEIGRHMGDDTLAHKVH